MYIISLLFIYTLARILKLYINIVVKSNPSRIGFSDGNHNPSPT